MIAFMPSARKGPVWVVLCACLALLTACAAPIVPDSGGEARPAAAPIRVALLVPQSDPNVSVVAQSLENAARLAVSDNPRTPVELMVYDTAGQAEVAAARATEAVENGAQLIAGPLFGAAANAAGRAVAGMRVPVLSFSNTPSIAGGNVFILGQTFENTATRLLNHAARQGLGTMVLIHPNDNAGQTARLAVEQAAAQAGISILANESYDLQIAAVANAAQRARASAEAGADIVFITTDATNAAMPTLLQLLPENGVDPTEVQYIGLTRWDVRPDLFALPGADGGWFAVPDRRSQSQFEARYTEAFGTAPHPLAGLAYDSIVAALGASTGGRNPQIEAGTLTRARGFDGATGQFTLREDGTNARSLAVASVDMRQVTIIDPAPSGLAPGF